MVKNLTEIKNSNDLRNECLNNFKDLKTGTLSVKKSQAMTNLARAIMNSVGLEIKQNGYSVFIPTKANEQEGQE